MKVATSVVFVKMIVKLAAILFGIIFTCNMIAMPRKILAVTVHALMHAAYIIWSLYCNCILSMIGAVMNERDTNTMNESDLNITMNMTNSSIITPTGNLCYLKCYNVCVSLCCLES